MTFDSFLRQICEIKKISPKGESAQQLMVPFQRVELNELSPLKKQHAKESAVLMLLFPKKQSLSILLIERSGGQGVHAGQIGFPGGRYESFDGDLKQTALREANEEVGICPDMVQVLMPFSPLYIEPSNFLVQPYLGFIKEYPKLKLCEDEVARVIELPLEELMDDSIVQNVKIQTSYRKPTFVPAFVYQNHTIWGATAMMLSELKETLKPLYEQALS